MKTCSQNAILAPAIRGDAQGTLAPVPQNPLAKPHFQTLQNHLIPMDTRHKTDVTLPHHIDLNQATLYLVHHLDCDEWHVVSHPEHEMIVQMAKGTAPKFIVRYECTPPVEKAIYHGSRAFALSIIPVHAEDNLHPDKVAELKTGLAGLH